MERWMISIDESGVFDNKEKYFVIAGILYKESDFEEVRDYFVPLANKISEIIGENELHCSKLSKKKKDFVRKVMFSHIGHFSKVKAFAYIIDKDETILLKKYDKKSFQYNAVLSFFYNDLISNKLIKEEDEVGFLLDNITLNKKEQLNLTEWLPNEYKKILFVKTGDSKDFKFIQMADIIANFFSKNGKCDTKEFYFKMLNPFIEVFPKRYRKNYFI